MADWNTQPWFHEFEPIRVIPRGFDDPQTAVPVLFTGFPTIGRAGFGLRFRRFDEVEHPGEAFFDGRNLYSCALASGHDLFAYWRGCLLLARCRAVDPWLVQHCLFWTVARGEHFRDDENERKIVIEALDGGQDALDAVMRERPPAWLVDKIVELCSLPWSAPWTSPITDERRVGTIVWREEFDRIGALTPEESDRREAVWERIRPTYLLIIPRVTLAAYSHACRGRGENALWQARDALVALADAGAEEEHGPHVVAALAFVASQRANTETLDRMMSALIEPHPRALARGCDARERQFLKQLAPWVARRERAGSPFDPAQVAAAQALLAALLARYFPVPSHEEQMRSLLQGRYGITL